MNLHELWRPRRPRSHPSRRWRRRHDRRVRTRWPRTAIASIP